MPTRMLKDSESYRPHTRHRSRPSRYRQGVRRAAPFRGRWKIFTRVRERDFLGNPRRRPPAPPHVRNEVTTHRRTASPPRWRGAGGRAGDGLTAVCNSRNTKLPELCFHALLMENGVESLEVAR